MTIRRWVFILVQPLAHRKHTRFHDPSRAHQKARSVIDPIIDSIVLKACAHRFFGGCRRLSGWWTAGGGKGRFCPCPAARIRMARKASFMLCLVLMVLLPTRVSPSTAVLLRDQHGSQRRVSWFRLKFIRLRGGGIEEEDLRDMDKAAGPVSPTLAAMIRE